MPATRWRPAARPERFENACPPTLAPRPLTGPRAGPASPDPWVGPGPSIASHSLGSDRSSAVTAIADEASETPYVVMEVQLGDQDFIGLVPEGLRIDSHSTGVITDGLLAGATTTGVDYLLYRHDGVGVSLLEPHRLRLRGDLEPGQGRGRVHLALAGAVTPRAQATRRSVAPA